VNSHWLAAMLLLDAPSLRGRVDAYVDHDEQIIDSSILNVPWSSAERRLIQLALSLSSPEHDVNLHDALDGFDDRNARRVVTALWTVIGPPSTQLRQTQDQVVFEQHQL
jgi:hypothetical protein